LTPSNSYTITNLTASNITASGTSIFGTVGIGTNNPTARLHVSGSTGGVFEVDTIGGATTLYVSSSGNVGVGTTSSLSKLSVYASGSDLSVFRVDGANGTLFEVTDNLSGSLFSVNTIAGFPVLEAFSDNTVVAGKYGSNVFVLTGSNIGIGTNVPAFTLDVSGSSRHGFTSTNTHQFTGSVNITGPVTATSFTGSFSGSIGTAVSSSYALSASYAPVNTNITASWATNALTASSLVAANSYTITNLTASNITASGTSIFGTVGIGTTLPSAKFHISASTGQAPLRIESQDSADTVPQIYVEGNQAVGSPALATNIQLASNQDYRGRGITFTNRTTSTSWFSGIPYTGGSYQIGYDSTTNGRAHYVQSSSLIILSNGNIGIGTSSPGYKLTIQNDVASTNSLLALQNFSTSSTTNHGVSILPILSDNTGSTAITAGGLYWLKEQPWTNDTTSRDSYLRIDTTENGLASEKVRITSAGNVGIGITNPTSKLHIVTTGTNDGIILDGSTNPIFIHRTSGSDRTYLATITSAGSFFTDANAYDFVIRSQTSNILLGRGSGASTMAIVGSNVGIGVVSPSGRLHITGSATASETLLYLSKGSGSITQNYINAVDQAGSINYRVTSDINGYSQQTLYRSGTSYVYHDAYWSSWINNANYAQGGLALGTGSLTHGYALNISRPATSGSLYVSGSSVFTGSVSISGSVTFSGPIIYDNAVLLDYGSTSTPVVSTNYAVLQNLTGSYNSAFFDYFASSGSNFRAGTVIAGWSGSSINYTEYSTTDVGNTNELSMSVDLSGSFVRLLTRVSTTINWNIKSTGRYL
jgi:hypothetical protein